MKTIIAINEYSLVDLGSRGSPLPFCWYKDIEGYKAEGRDDGWIYISGFSTRAKAEAWAVKEGIITLNQPSADQGEL